MGIGLVTRHDGEKWRKKLHLIRNVREEEKQSTVAFQTIAHITFRANKFN